MLRIIQKCLKCRLRAETFSVDNTSLWPILRESTSVSKTRRAATTRNHACGAAFVRQFSTVPFETGPSRRAEGFAVARAWTNNLQANCTQQEMHSRLLLAFRETIWRTVPIGRGSGIVQVHAPHNYLGPGTNSRNMAALAGHQGQGARSQGGRARGERQGRHNSRVQVSGCYLLRFAVTDLCFESKSALTTPATRHSLCPSIIS